MKETGFFAEFRKFIARGNVMDMAVGLVVGSAFTAIVNSLVNDIIMPIVGLLTGGIDFQNLQIVLKPATESAEAVVIRYGLFINKMREASAKKEEAAAAAAPAAPAPDIVLLTEIRDLLKK